jgi:ribosomal-protein-alanine N-acetyltransferase
MLNHVGTQQLETNRLILRRHEMTDVNDVYNNWVTDPEVRKFWSWDPHKNIEETKEFLIDLIGKYEKVDTYIWIIELKYISQAIGYIYLNDIDDINDSVSVHFALSRKYWKQGFITEACKRVLDFAFSVLQVKRIHTHHHINNPASGKVMQKCGMKFIETAYRSIPDCERISGNYCYYEIYYNN